MSRYSRVVVSKAFEDLRRRLGYRPGEARNRILVVQSEGIGNAILTTPLIEALTALEPRRRIDVAVDDSRGTRVVFDHWPLVSSVWNVGLENETRGSRHYEHVLECHPRKKLPENVYYRRRWSVRPPGPASLEYYWRFDRHEAEVLLDHARRLGFRGASPKIRPVPQDLEGVALPPDRAIAIGIGYFKGRRPDGRDWSDRHWGNQRFLELCRLLLAENFAPVIVGTSDDLSLTRFPLPESGATSVCGRYSLAQMAGFLSGCRAFVGNDTGLMHVAASIGLPTVGIFVSTNSIKSYPLGERAIAVGGDRGPRLYDIDVDEVAAALHTVLAK